MNEPNSIFSPLKGDLKSVVICAHVNPDGDAIGSSLALKHYIERKRKEATVIVPNHFPDFLKWMPGADSILIYNNAKQKEQIKSAIEKADLVIVCDLNQPNRLADLEQDIMQSTAPRILIDHHLDPADFCTVTVSEPVRKDQPQRIRHVPVRRERLFLYPGDETASGNRQIQ